MKSFFNLVLIVLTFSFTTQISAQDGHTHKHSRVIYFPDVEEFKTISSDFHIHTVFSDGHVWPSIRVAEAVKDQLDAISVTDHIEYQPHKEDIPNPDLNRSYNLALKNAKNTDLLIVRGTEITRDMPPGHSNALFVQDVNKLIIEDSLAVFQEARKQEAFVFWNHPNWTAQVKDGVARLTDMHEHLIRNNLLHGIEVVNDRTYSDEALQIALDNNLAIMGTSDIHVLVDWQYNIAEGGHRPVTLVLAKEKTIESIKEAMFDLRTIAFYNNILIGRKHHLSPLIDASIVVDSVRYTKDVQVAEVTLTNLSCADFLMQNRSDYTLHEHTDLVRIKPYETIQIYVKTLKREESFEMDFELLNTIIAPNTHLVKTFQFIPVQR